MRNADRQPTSGIPLAITFAAGNYGQRVGDLTKAVMAPATAKNVIAVGAAESRRSILTGTCPDTTRYAEGYDKVAYVSRRGTNDSRLKPDLIAPASMALGPRGQLLTTDKRYCETVSDDSKASPPQYHGATGTSFAAPVAAGSIALLRYYYSRYHGGFTPSPAMYKAMLVAGARSLAGGQDRLESVLQGTTRYVTGWPSAPQGFGRIMLTDLLSALPQKSWHDQATLLLQGQEFSRTVTVGDPGKPVRIVLAWTDAAAMPGAQVTLVNDLRLSAQLPSYPWYLGGNFTDSNGWSRTHATCTPSNPLACVTPPNDARNNVEVLNIQPSRFTDPANRTFTVRVKASTLNAEGVKGASGGTYNQDFALFVMNGTMQ